MTMGRREGKGFLLVTFLRRKTWEKSIVWQMILEIEVKCRNVKCYQLWEGIIVGAPKENSYLVFFVVDHEISDIKHQLTQFC